MKFEFALERNAEGCVPYHDEDGNVHKDGIIQDSLFIKKYACAVEKHCNTILNVIK